ncbi:hypothetical protein [Egbenema bharatensis]|uniref:hypothetical protein n=1 Tax=Egbenema bharatensis TaxID=3463334 RepID=UPI003A8BA1A4
MAFPEMARFSVSLPDWYYRKLLLWAKLKGTNRATLSSNIIQSRIEANWNEIERELEAIAKYQGKTLDELTTEWLSDDLSE